MLYPGLISLSLWLFAELPCCRPCQNTGGYLPDISLPSTCERPSKDCQKLGARCCRGPRVEGCSCPNGTFFDGKKCVNQTQQCSRPCVGGTTSVTSSTTSIVSSTSSIRYFSITYSYAAVIIVMVMVMIMAG